MFNFASADTPRSTWNVARPEATVKVMVDSEAYNGQYVVCDNVPAQYLFATAPALKKYFHDGRVVLPGYSLNDDILDHVVDGIVTCGRQYKQFELSIAENPVAYINTHIVLTLFEMKKEATILINRMWGLFDVFELGYGDVIWIWENFGPQSDGSYAHRPGHAAVYVQMMAWQLVAAKNMNKLNPILRELIYGTQYGDYRRLRGIIEAREKTYGTAQFLEAPTTNTAVKPVATIAPPKSVPTENTKRKTPMKTTRGQSHHVGAYHPEFTNAFKKLNEILQLASEQAERPQLSSEFEKTSAMPAHVPKKQRTSSSSGEGLTTAMSISNSGTQDISGQATTKQPVLLKQEEGLNTPHHIFYPVNLRTAITGDPRLRGNSGLESSGMVLETPSGTVTGGGPGTMHHGSENATPMELKYGNPNFLQKQDTNFPSDNNLAPSKFGVCSPQGQTPTAIGSPGRQTYPTGMSMSGNVTGAPFGSPIFGSQPPTVGNSMATNPFGAQNPMSPNANVGNAMVANPFAAQHPMSPSADNAMASEFDFTPPVQSPGARRIARPGGRFRKK